MMKSRKKMKMRLAALLAAVCCTAWVTGCGAAQKGDAAKSASVADVVSEADAANDDAAAETAGDSAAGSGLEDASEGVEDANGAETVGQDQKDAETADSTESRAAASGSSAEDVVVRVGGLKGPTTMGLVKLMDEAAKGDTENQYEFTMVTAADELTALVASGKVDIALLPANVASILYQKTEGKISVIDINTLGVLYLVSADTSIASVEQLKGRTVYLPVKGTTPEYALRYLISAAGLGENDVTLEFKSEALEVASVLAEDPDAIGLLPQPFVTSALTQNDALSIVMDLTEVWDSYQTEENPSRLVTGVTIVSRDFLEAHRDSVDIFLKEHEASIQFTAKDPAAAAALIEDAGIVAKAAIAQKALPYCNITFVSGSDLKDVLEGYLGALFEQNPASVGGALPDDGFYYIP